MLTEQAYNAFDKELFRDRQLAKELIFKFNRLEPSKIKERNQLLKNLLGKMGKNCYFEPPFRCDYGYNIEIGDNFYSNYNLVILDGAEVKIGNNVFIAPNVSLFTAGHPVHFEPRNQAWEYAIPITIGDNVWIGGNSVINPGVEIGKNSVIGSGSVVTKNIPENCIAVGNPCKVIRKITEEDKKYYFKNLEF